MRNIICIHWKTYLDQAIVKNVLDDVELTCLWIMPIREYQIEDEEKRKEIALHNFHLFGTEKENEMIPLVFINHIFVAIDNEINEEKYYELLDHLEDENFIGLEIISKDKIQLIAEKADHYFSMIDQVQNEKEDN